MSTIKMNLHEKLKNLGLILGGSVIYGIGTQCFLSNAKIAPGGASGIGLMANYLTGAPIGTVTFLINIPLLILAWLYLSRAFAMKTALACAVSSAVMDLVIYLPAAARIPGGLAAQLSLRRRAGGAWYGTYLPVRLHHRRK